MKHTPWNIVEYGNKEDGSPKFYTIKHGELTIANLGNTDKYAALIVAVPELLELLKLAVRYLEHPDVQALQFALPASAIVERCNAAIAKAEGRKYEKD